MIQGTTYYKITLDEIKKAYEDDNCIMFGALSLYGWDAVDINRYHIGSDIIDNVLYLCVTDGEPIKVDDPWAEDGLIDPEEALYAIGPEPLEEYIESADNDTILKYVTPYDLSDDLDLNEIAMELLDAGYSLQDIIRDAADAQLVEI